MTGNSKTHREEKAVVEDVVIGRWLAGLRCRLRVFFRAWLRENRNGLETHDRGGGIEDREGECVREDRNDT